MSYRTTIKAYTQAHYARTPNWAQGCGIPCNPYAQPGDFDDPFDACSRAHGPNPVCPEGPWDLNCNKSIPGGWGSMVDPNFLCDLTSNGGNCVSGACGVGEDVVNGQPLKYGNNNCSSRAYARHADLEVPFIKRQVIVPSPPCPIINPNGCVTTCKCTGPNKCEQCCEPCIIAGQPTTVSMYTPPPTTYIEYSPQELPMVADDLCYAPWVQNISWLRRTYAGRFDNTPHF